MLKSKRNNYYDVHENCLIFKTPHPPCPSTFKFFPPSWPWRSNFEWTPHSLKQTMEQQPHLPCKRTKSKQKQNQVMSHSNWPRVLLLDLAHKQCNGIFKEWLQCLTPKSIGIFLVNNVLMFETTLCLVIAQIEFSLIKKIKIGRPEHLLPSPLPTSDNISFLLQPPSP